MAFHFEVARDDLFPAISAQQNIISKKGTLAIISNVLIEVKENEILLTGTDLEIGLRQSVQTITHEKGTITLPAKKLFELVRESSSATLSFKEIENNWVEINAGSSVYKLAGLASDEYPTFPEYEESKLVEIEASILNELIDKTIFSISSDKENMYSLTAALFKKEQINEQRLFKLITSDGHRLTLMSKEVNEDVFKIELNPVTLIPRKGVQEISKFCDGKNTILFGIEKKQAVLKNDDSLLIIRLMEGEFPNYQSILNLISRDNFIKINKLQFLESLKRINLFTEELFNAIKIEINKNKLMLSSQNPDYGSAKDEFDISYDGEPLTLGFNCRYFIDTLQVIEGTEINAYINSNESPCLITSDEDDGFLSIIMPMKL